MVVENLYGLQRLQQTRLEEQAELYRLKCEEADELTHEIARLSKQKLPHKLIKHQTKQTQAADPKLAHVGVQSVADRSESGCQSDNKTYGEA